MDIEQMRNELTIVIGRIQLAQLHMRKLRLCVEAQEDLEQAEAAAWRLTERLMAATLRQN